MDSDSGFGLFDGISEDEPVSRSPEFNRNVYRVDKDGTELHRAIRKGDQRWIDDILTVFQEDFNKIRDYLVENYQCDLNERVWLRKINFIALGEDQCKSCKEFEKRSVKCADLDKAIFIVLKAPISGDKVAVLHPTETNRLEVFRLVRTILHNGCISWNYPGIQMDPDGRDETFVETAILCGRNDIVARLLELGAALSIPNHNALVAACLPYRRDTIHWLLTEHFDDFDCTQRNSKQMNAFLVLMGSKKLEMMDFVLQRMLSYRQKYFDETESEAFNQIFHYQNEAHVSSITYLERGPIQDKVEDYIVRYRLDLSYQWRGVTILEWLFKKRMALEYCWSEIRRNPNLLGLEIYEGSTIVHACIKSGLLDILKEMYEHHPEVKQFFEKEDSFGCLGTVLVWSCRESALFILDNHAEYFLKHLDKLKEKVLLNIYNPQDFYETNGELLAKYFPELKMEIHEQMKKEQEFHLDQDFRLAFRNIDLDFADNSVKVKDPSQSLSSITGLKGITLLHYAANEDNTKLFNDLLEAGCSIDAVDAEGNHPIHYVQSTEMFDLIIEKHPEGRSLVHRTNCEGQTVLHRIFAFSLAQPDLIELMEKIIEFGADVNQLTNNGESIAFMIDSSIELDVLQKYNINLDVVNHEGITVLERHLMLENGCVATALLHLFHELPSFRGYAHKCLDFFLRDYQPFLEANPDTTKLICDSVYNHSRDYASRLFFKACYCGHFFIAEKFLEFDYDLDYNYQNQNGCTPIIRLLRYMEEPNIHLVRRLLAKGVNLELRDRWGWNALLTLAKSCKLYGYDTGMVQMLLNHGAHIDSTDDDGNTALHYALRVHEWKLVEVLIENGANLSVKNKDGKTPAQVASKNYEEFFKFML